MDAKPAIDEYLNSLTARVKQKLGENVIGIYLTGSLAYDDFSARSDIDVLAVSRVAVPRRLKDELARELSNDSLRCPAAGLDFILASLDCASSVPDSPTFEFSISTGEKWETEVEYGGVYEELLLEFAICREFGQVLYGPAPGEVFAVVHHERLGEVLRNVIEWHRRHLFHPFHDPLGHYAVLNACRAWRFAEENVLSSKTGGGEWVLARRPAEKVVRDALDIRLGRNSGKLDRLSVEQFLDVAERGLAG